MQSFVGIFAVAVLVVMLALFAGAQEVRTWENPFTQISAALTQAQR